MLINLGVPAYLSGGDKGPPIDGVIVEPSYWAMTHVVVGEGGPKTDKKLVPVSMVQAWADDRVVLRLTADDLSDLPDYIERTYATPRQLLFAAQEAGTGNLPAKELFTQEGLPFEPGLLPHETQPIQSQEKPSTQPASGPIEVRDGAPIEALDGLVGKLDQLTLDTYSERITYFVVNLGGGAKVRVPVEWVAYIDPGCIRLAATRQQLRALVGPPAGN